MCSIRKKGGKVTSKWDWNDTWRCHSSLHSSFNSKPCLLGSTADANTRSHAYLTILKSIDFLQVAGDFWNLILLDPTIILPRLIERLRCQKCFRHTCMYHHKSVPHAKKSIDLKCVVPPLVTKVSNVRPVACYCVRKLTKSRKLTNLRTSFFAREKKNISTHSILKPKKTVPVQRSWGFSWLQWLYW